MFAKNCLTIELAHFKLKYGLFSTIISCHVRSVQKCHSLCSKCATRTRTQALKATFHYSSQLQTWLQTWLSTRVAARFLTSSCGFATSFRHAFEFRHAFDFFVENLVANLLHQSRRLQLAFDMLSTCLRRAFDTLTQVESQVCSQVCSLLEYWNAAFRRRRHWSIASTIDWSNCTHSSIRSVFEFTWIIVVSYSEGRLLYYKLNKLHKISDALYRID